jgi:hypothetical protein
VGNASLNNCGDIGMEEGGDGDVVQGGIGIGEAVIGRVGGVFIFHSVLFLFYFRNIISVS